MRILPRGRNLLERPQDDAMTFAPLSSRLANRIRLAAELWQDIRETPYPADRWLGGYFHQNRKKIGSQDRRFFSETLYGAFRNKLFLEAWTSFLGSPEDPGLMMVLSAVAAGVMSPEEAVSWSQARGFPGQPAAAQAPFETVARFDLPPGHQEDSEVERLSVRFSFPRWLVDHWISGHGLARTQQLLRTFHQKPFLSIRANPLKISRQELLTRLKECGEDVFPSADSPYGILFRERIPIFNLEEFREGLFEVQDTGSQRVCAAVDPKPGETLWDVCAGGGGKSLLLAALMENKGRVVATDIREKKLEDLKKRAKRAGVFNIFPADIKRMGSMTLARKGFDKILVDAPCSGTGTLRRNPDAKWKLSPEKILGHQKDQYGILREALPYLKKGGRLFYVTCSIENAENEAVMDRLVLENSGLRPVPVEGFGEVSGFWRRLWPGEENDGFFLGAVEKTGEDS